MNSFKTYYSIMYILDLIFGIFFCITIVGAIFGVPLIICGNKFNKARNMSESELVKNKSSLLGWGIFNALVFSGTVLGFIIVLGFTLAIDSYIDKLNPNDDEVIIESKDFSESVSEDANKIGSQIKEGASKIWSSTKSALNIKSEDERLEERLAKAKKMYEDGIITEEEYKEMRKGILNIK